MQIQKKKKKNNGSTVHGSDTREQDCHFVRERERLRTKTKRKISESYSVKREREREIEEREWLRTFKALKGRVLIDSSLN